MRDDIKKLTKKWHYLAISHPKSTKSKIGDRQGVKNLILDVYCSLLYHRAISRTMECVLICTSHECVCIIFLQTIREREFLYNLIRESPVSEAITMTAKYLRGEMTCHYCWSERMYFRLGEFYDYVSTLPPRFVGTCRLSYQEINKKRESEREKSSEIQYIAFHFYAI